MTRKVTGRILDAPPMWWGEFGPEGRGGGRGDDAAWRHPADERALSAGQLGLDRGEERHQRAGHHH
jgi:hypothetical protein